MSIESLDTYAAFDAACLTVIRQARSELICFDIDLTKSVLPSARAVDALGAFMHAGIKHRLTLLLHNSDHLARGCPRLLDLYQRRSHQFTVNVIAAQHRNQLQPFICADGRHVATRFHADHPRGKLIIDEATEAAWFSAQFETLNESSSAATGLAALGI